MYHLGIIICQKKLCNVFARNSKSVGVEVGVKVVVGVEVVVGVGVVAGAEAVVVAEAVVIEKAGDREMDERRQAASKQNRSNLAAFLAEPQIKFYYVAVRFNTEEDEYFYGRLSLAKSREETVLLAQHNDARFEGWCYLAPVVKIVPVRVMIEMENG